MQHSKSSPQCLLCGSSSQQVVQSFERVRRFQKDNSKAKSIKAKIMEFIALGNQPFSVAVDLPELHINSVTAISFTTYILWNDVWVFACQKIYSNTVKVVQKSLQTSRQRPRMLCLQYCVGNKA